MMGNWNEVQEMFKGWDECLAVARNFSDHYSLTEEQQSFVYRYAMQIGAGGVAMEIGVCNGRTAAVIAHCAAKRGFEAHGIDGFILENSKEQLDQQMAALNLPFTIHYGLTGFATIPGRPHLGVVPWDRPLDFLLIDGSHTDPWATDDFTRWLPLLKPGCAVMFHDYDGREDLSSAHLPVRQGVDRLTAAWGMEYYVSGLMIKRKPL